MSATASESEGREFARRFRSFLDWVHSGADEEHVNEVVALVRDYLGAAGIAESVVTRELAPFEHVNLQTALDVWSLESGRTVTVRGVSVPMHHGGTSLNEIVTAEVDAPLRLAAPPLIDLPNGVVNGVRSTLACLLRALLLVEDPRGRYVLMITGPIEHENGLRVEIAGLAVPDAQAVHAELDALRARLNVYRGHLIDVSVSNQGALRLEFSDVRATPRADVVLPEEVLTRVERHALGVSRHADALRAAGQHLKRGLLLFGPPGTGKTHTTRYLVGEMTGYTRLPLTGRALTAIGAVADLARELQPAVIVPASRPSPSTTTPQPLGEDSAAPSTSRHDPPT